jgi:2-polyprenyl-3-methyl-5-hydroxy-6-metoxy-1,4-benzoquinol methylase
MSFNLIARIRPLRKVLYSLATWRVEEKIVEIGSHLQPGDRVLDVGAGNCVLSQTLQKRGYDVVPLDLRNHSFIDEIKPVIYDGEAIPFDDDSFDVALLITVLHHARKPDAVLAEARRVAKRVIVIEEIYENSFEKYFTYAIDSLFNLEFFDHPRSNRDDSGWKVSFQTLGLKLRDAAYSRSLYFLRRVTYVLERAPKTA